MPNLLSAAAARKYAMTVAAQPMANATGKLNRQRMSNGGSAANRTKDGSTSQKTLVEKWASRDVSCVSRQSQIMARMETSGSDATSAPKNELRFASSEIAKMRKAETRIFRIGCNTDNVLYT
jgi:hypothetical protein